MTTTVTCERCGKQFTGWHNRRFCTECSQTRNVIYMRQYVAAHRDDAQWQARRRECRRRYNKKKEAQACLLTG